VKGFIYLYTPLGTTLYRSLTHTGWYPQSITDSTSRFLATASTEGDSSASHDSGSLVTDARVELMSTYNTTNWVLGWRPFHANLLVFFSQADFN
jgi:hypothetical protein